MQYSEAFSFPMPQLTDDADITKVSDAISMIDAEIYKTREMDAEKYDPTHTYNTGDVVWNLESLWKCKEDNVTGTWDATKWDAKTLAELIAEAGGMSPITAEAEGNPIEITDAASAPLVKCVTEIQGSQDLHGYDKPWVGGAGKNKFEITATSTPSATILTDDDGNIVGIKISRSGSGVATINLGTFTIESGKTYTMSGSPSGAGVDTYRIDARYGGSVYPSSNEWNDASNPTITATETKTLTIMIRIGANYTADNVIFRPQIEEGQTATTFAPYSNICPITAYTEGEVVERGKNLVKQIVQGYINSATNAIRIDNDTETVLFKAEQGETYTFSSGVTTNRNVIGYVGVDELVNGTPVTNIQTLSSYTWTAEWSGWTAWYINASVSADIEATAQVEKGGTATSYEAPNFTTHTTTFPSAIYRGSEDVVNGEVTNDMPVIDLGDLSWSAYSMDSTGHSFYADVPSGAKSVSSDSDVANLVCENYATVAFRYPNEWINKNGVICQVPNSQRWIIRDERFSDATSFSTEVTGVKLAYELATPTTTSVTPTNLPIKSLLGYNHIESTTGDMEIEYYTQDWQKIIDLIEEESGGESEENHEYSTTAKKVGTWIDGRDIYEIVYTGTFSISSTGTTIGETLPNGCTVLSAQAVNKTGHGDGGCVQCAPLVIMENNTNSTFTAYSNWGWNVDAKAIIIQYIEASS